MKDVTQSSQDWEDFWYNSPINSPYIAMTQTQTKDKSQYELFHEWLNNCPTQIEDYQDNIDSVTIRFMYTIEEELV